MGGHASWSIWPFSSDVVVGDNAAAGKNKGAPPILAALSAAQLAKDDIDDQTPKGRAQADRYVQQQVDKGIFNAVAIAIGNKSIAEVFDLRPQLKEPGTERVDCTAIHSGFDLNTKLTSKTTLGDFINRLPQIPKYKYKSVPAQMGLTPDQIVCNLANLCFYVWEPIKAKYPNAIITCSLRTGADIGKGPHGYGQGMDIQFNTPAGVSIPTRDYYDIAVWVKDNVPTDQLILEYSTERGHLVSWLHVGYFAGDPRTVPGAVVPPWGKKVEKVNRVLTMMNHHVINVGLANHGK